MKKLLTLLLFVFCTNVSAQWKGPIFSFNGDEVVGGAMVNVFLHGPWVSKPWKREIPRAALFETTSFFYEVFLDPWRWQGGMDFWQRTEGYVGTEVVIVGGKWLLKRIF